MFGGGVGSALGQTEVWQGGRRFSEAAPPFADEPIGIAATDKYVFKGVRHQVSSGQWRWVLARYDLAGNLLNHIEWPDALGTHLPHSLVSVLTPQGEWRVYMVGEVSNPDGGADAAVVAFKDDASVAWSWVYMPDDYDAYRDERAVSVERALGEGGSHTGITVGMQSTRSEGSSGLRTRFMYTAFNTGLAYGKPRHPPRRFQGEASWNDLLLSIRTPGDLSGQDRAPVYMTGTSYKIGTDDTRIMTLGYDAFAELYTGFPLYVQPTEMHTYTAAGITAGHVDAAYVLGTQWPRPNVNELPKYITLGYHHDITHFEQWRMVHGAEGRANIASDIALNELIGSPATTEGQRIHVTGTSSGAEGSKALTLQYFVLYPPDPPDLEWSALWPDSEHTTIATEGMGVALSRVEVVPSGCNPAPPAADGVFLAAAARDGASSWALGTIKYSLAPPLAGEPKLPWWDAVRDGGSGDDIPIAIYNWGYAFPLGQGCTSNRFVWPIGRSVGPQGNDTSLATMYDDHAP